MVREVPAALIELRRLLHQHPELSGREVATAGRIKGYLMAYPPEQLIEAVGGHGLLAIYDFDKPGPSVMIRCELDALPIDEPNTFEYRSRRAGVSHKCGHDGHMTIVAGLSPWLYSRPFQRGRVILLFQPAEENGQGAKAMLDDHKFGDLRPDYVFALHNIPGFPLHQIIQVDRQFSATVKSMVIRLHGQQSHAAEPENGRNPAWAMADIMHKIDDFIIADPTHPDFTLITPVHTTMGQRDYGISAGYGELHFTLRTWSMEKMEDVVCQLEAIGKRVGDQFGLEITFEYLEYFPATPNEPTANLIIEKAARAGGLELVRQTTPFKFGEDFGWFAQAFKGAMFGLGAGKESPVLHNEQYDFPEPLIWSGITVFKEIIQKVLKD